MKEQCTTLLKAYVMHPLVGDGSPEWGDQQRNVDRYLRICAWLTNQGYAIATWVHHYFLHEAGLTGRHSDGSAFTSQECHDFYLARDFRLMDGCDEAMAFGPPRVSTGLGAEVEYAWDHRIPVLVGMRFDVDGARIPFVASHVGHESQWQQPWQDPNWYPPGYGPDEMPSPIGYIPPHRRGFAFEQGYRSRREGKGRDYRGAEMLDIELAQWLVGWDEADASLRPAGALTPPTAPVEADPSQHRGGPIRQGAIWPSYIAEASPNGGAIFLQHGKGQRYWKPLHGCFGLRVQLGNGSVHVLLKAPAHQEARDLFNGWLHAAMLRCCTPTVEDPEPWATFTTGPARREGGHAGAFELLNEQGGPVLSVIQDATGNESIYYMGDRISDAEIPDAVLAWLKSSWIPEQEEPE